MSENDDLRSLTRALFAQPPSLTIGHADPDAESDPDDKPGNYVPGEGTNQRASGQDATMREFVQHLFSNID